MAFQDNFNLQFKKRNGTKLETAKQIIIVNNILKCSTTVKNILSAAKIVDKFYYFCCLSQAFPNYHNFLQFP